MTKKEDDIFFVQLLQKGNVAAFDSLFAFYSNKIYRFALKYLKDETDAEELVQDVFIKVWENRSMLKSTLSFKSYLFTIALNCIRKHFNKRAISLRYIEALQKHCEPSENEAFINEDYELAVKQINQLIDQLPPRQREILLKSKIECKSSKEIAEELNISPGTVDNQVSEAMRQIRSKLVHENVKMLLFAALFLS
jgi:RNA polymerase sigma-70 factor (ECF subfamily)